MSLVETLKKNNQDFEWYPTTEEILNEMIIDLKGYSKSYKHGIAPDGCYKNDEKTGKNIYVSHTNLKSLLEIGAGDGRVFDYLKENKILISDKIAIEKSRIHSLKLIKKGINLIGIDFFDSILIMNDYTIVFSNPPFSKFKEWTMKIMEEVNADVIYLVIPERWKKDMILSATMRQKGKLTILGDFNFSEADRATYGKHIVNLVKIEKVQKEGNFESTFEKWVENNIGDFTLLNEEKIENEEFINNKIQEKKNQIENLVDAYEHELNENMKAFKSLSLVDPKMLVLLGITKKDLLSKIKEKINSLKIKYWTITFNTFDIIAKKLTYKKRYEIINKIRNFKLLDFNKDNIDTIVIWLIENFNKFSDEQLLEVYDGLTDREKVIAYKSNEKWDTNTWRYSKPVPTKYKLDYRLIANVGYNILESYRRDNSMVKNISIIANILGFHNKGIDSKEENPNNHIPGKTYHCYLNNEEVLFQYKIYKNNNVHFKFDQKFFKVFNIEVGKLRQWIKKPSDIVTEFDMNIKEANLLFKNSKNHLTIGAAKQLLLT